MASSMTAAPLVQANAEPQAVSHSGSEPPSQPIAGTAKREVPDVVSNEGLQPIQKLPGVQEVQPSAMLPSTQSLPYAQPLTPSNESLDNVAQPTRFQKVEPPLQVSDQPSTTSGTPSRQDSQSPIRKHSAESAATASLAALDPASQSSQSNNSASVDQIDQQSQVKADPGTSQPPPGIAPSATPSAKGDDQPQPGTTVCHNCLTTTTPLWRRDENGQILCNACGLFLKLHGRRRPISLKTDVIKSRNRSRNPSSTKRQNPAKKPRVSGSPSFMPLSSPRFSTTNNDTAVEPLSLKDINDSARAAGQILYMAKSGSNDATQHHATTQAQPKQHRMPGTVGASSMYDESIAVYKRQPAYARASRTPIMHTLPGLASVAPQQSPPDRTHAGAVMPFHDHGSSQAQSQPHPQPGTNERQSLPSSGTSPSMTPSTATLVNPNEGVQIASANSVAQASAPASEGQSPALPTPPVLPAPRSGSADNNGRNSLPAIMSSTAPPLVQAQQGVSHASGNSLPAITSLNVMNPPMSPQFQSSAASPPDIRLVRGHMSEQLLPRSPPGGLERIPPLAHMNVSELNGQRQFKAPAATTTAGNSTSTLSSQELSTKVTELELVNDLLQRRITDLEYSENQARRVAMDAQQTAENLWKQLNQLKQQQAPA